MKLAPFCIFGVLLFPFWSGFALAEIVEFEFKGEFYSCERSSPEESVILVRGKDTVFRPESLLKKLKRKRARLRRTLRSSTTGQKRVQRLRNDSQELKKFIGFIKECQTGSLFDEPPSPTPTTSPTGSPSPTATQTPEPSPTVTPSPSPSPTPLPVNTVVVSPTGSYQTLAQAHQAVQDGWTILVESGTYLGQAALATITKDNLTIRGMGDRPVFDPDGLSTEGKAIWVIKGENTTIENIEFTGATVLDRNGAGIRFEGEDLTIIGCHFHHNEMGILSKSTGGGRIEITSSEFHHNGYGDGFSHNIYINRAAEFWLTFSSTHHAIIGHNVKSRAEKNYILYNRIMEEGDGNSSYSVDLPNGGLSYLIGNLIQQSPVAQNGNIISYGAEGLVWGNNTLYASHNTIVNDRQSGGTFFRIFNGTAQASNNLLIGNGTLNSGGTFVNTNNLLTTSAILVDRVNYNYALSSSASLAINQGIASGSGDGFPLTPTFEYLNPLGSQVRPLHGQIDIGALEYRP